MNKPSHRTPEAAAQRYGEKIANYVLGQASGGKTDVPAATSRLDALRRGWVDAAPPSKAAYAVAQRILAEAGVVVDRYSTYVGEGSYQDRIVVVLMNGVPVKPSWGYKHALDMRAASSQQKTEKFISGPTIPVMKTVHEDDRREIREVTITDHDGSRRRAGMLFIKGMSVLGNHYHDNAEYFTVVSGNPTVLTAPKDDPEAIAVQNFPRGGFVTMQPGEAHTFHFDGPGTLISTMDGEFDPSDIHPLPLEHPYKK